MGPAGQFLVFLFSVYINDLKEIIISECYLYADDTKIVSTVDNKIQLEKDIENAIVCSKENRLNFNFDKFKNVQFSLRKNQKQANFASSQQWNHLTGNTYQRLGHIFFRKFIMGSSLKFFSTKSKSEACLSKENNSK